jgi:hypothetical protein
MSYRTRLAAFVSAALVLAALQSPSLAQNQFGQIKKEATPYDGKGNIVEVGPQGIQIKDSDGKTLFVGFDQKTKIAVTGTAEPGFLSPGLLVRFTATMTNKGQVQDKITELAVVEASETNKVGAQPDLEPGKNLKEAEKEGPVTWIVVAPIRSFKNNQLMVAAGKAIKAEVAEDCKITVDVTNNGIALAQEGDEITVVGNLLQDVQTMGDVTIPGQVLAEKVDITLVKPLTAPGKKKGAKAKPVKKKKSN